MTSYQQKCLEKIQYSKKHTDYVEKEQGQNSHCIQEQSWNRKAANKRTGIRAS